MATACIACGTSPTKYKCTICRAPTDSLACFKAHAASHTDAEKAEAEAAAAAASKRIQEQAKPEPSTDNTLPAQDPFEAFATSSELQDLLKSQPQLREKLRKIHAAVRDSDSASAREYASRGNARGRGRGGGRGRGDGRRTPWQRPDDLERGMRALKDALISDGRNGGEMERFVEIVNKRSAALSADTEGVQPLGE